MGIALILSGGNGIRLGMNIPKQYIEINGRPIISYCIEQLSSHKDVNYIQIVAAEQWHNVIQKCLVQYDKYNKFKAFSTPGQTRQLSIYNALIDISQYASKSDTIIIHDAARPLVTKRLITDCFNACRGHDGVVPVLPMKDTVYMEDGNRIVSLLEREHIYAGQAPEAFVLGKYVEANKQLLPERILKINGSAEPAVMAGMDIVLTAGDENNFKITTMEDLERFRNCLERI